MEASSYFLSSFRFGLCKLLVDVCVLEQGRCNLTPLWIDTPVHYVAVMARYAEAAKDNEEDGWPISVKTLLMNKQYGGCTAEVLKTSMNNLSY